MSNSPSPRSNSAGLWVAIAGGLALLAALIVQWRAISDLRREVQSLRTQQLSAPADAAIQTLPAAAAANQAAAMEQVQKERLELLRLLGEVRQLRQQASTPTAGAPPGASLPVPPPASAVQSPDAQMQELSAAVLRGEAGALDKLAKLAAARRTMNPNEQAAVRSDPQSIFRSLGADAGKGNEAGLKALWQASRIRDLQGYAVQALGQAAGQGNEE